jgi:ABC-type polysaccharide/polyol phosphate export permease
LNSPLKQSNAARSMLSKINFPREALILAGLADAAWNLAIRMALLLPLLWFYSGARLSEANIRQPDEVLQALQSGNRPGAAALWSRLSDETRARLSGPGETASMEDRRAALRDALNGLISGPSLYEAQAFEGVALSSTTRQRLSAGAGSGKAERLNRLLIEDIFPGEIARNRLFSRPPLHALIWAPVGIAALLLLGVSIGLLITPVGLLYTDVSRGIGIIAGFGMLLTPVVYPPRTSGLVGWLTTWNPISPVLVTARDWLTGQEAAFTSGFWAVSAVAAATFIVAWFMYRLTMPLIVERMGG